MTAAEPLVLTTIEDLDAHLQDERPVLMLLWRESSPPRDVELALKEAGQKHVRKLLTLKVDARDNPALAERFELGKNTLLIGWYDGEVRLRRSKPWKSDVTLMAEDLVALLPVDEIAEEEADQQQAPADDKPVVVTEQTFVQQVINSKLPVLVDFWAEWCGPCKMVAPIMEKLAREFAGKVRFAKVDVDQNQQLAAQFGIQSIPTLMFVKGGKIVGQSAGAAPEAALRDALNQLIALPV